MKRETISMEDVFIELEEEDSYNLYENSKLYTLIQEDTIQFDSEKGFSECELVFKRSKDDKFFKVEFTEFRHNENNMREMSAIEVFPHSKTIIEYK